MKRSRSLVGCASILLASLFVPASARAQSDPDFFRNKQIRLIVGFAAGNEYDLGARLLARHWARHIPGNPNIIVQNMPAAASVVAANYIATQAPADGTVIGAITRNVVNQALLGHPNLVADPKKLIWIGGTSFPGRVCVAGRNAPTKDAADLFTKELIVGSNGAGNSTHILPTVFNQLLGTKFKIVEGYRGTADILLAIERDEVQGVCASYGQFKSSAKLFQDGKLRILFRAEEAAMPEIPDAKSIYDFAKTEQQKQFMRFVFSSTEYGRPYVLPPGVPADRVQILRKAFVDAVNDPQLIAEAEKSQIDMSFRSPEDLEAITASLYSTPPGLIEDVKKLLPNMN
ncbi:MAG: tripartite tricarboxylate transporter family receptor [Hyphomicrobiales bacterium]|nr:tripartite tricarboxylate transporter family receptor [Hyphomicrobiales bacterium]